MCVCYGDDDDDYYDHDDDVGDNDDNGLVPYGARPSAGTPPISNVNQASSLLSRLLCSSV